MAAPSEGKPEHLIPIDIHYNKLLDWLIDRRHCPRQWQQNAIDVREKINNALQDMPESEEIAKLLAGTYINYFHCLKIVEILRGTEASSKNVFGRYSSQRMKDWQEVATLYEADGLYLAECGQMLQRYANYEIPALKKSCEKARKAQEDCTKKQRDYITQAAEWKDKYLQKCAAMGIKGEKVRQELIALVEDLCTSLGEVAAQTKYLKPAAEYYYAFTQFTVDGMDPEAGKLPLLTFLQQHGNATAFQWRTGVAPDRVDIPVLDTGAEEEQEQEGGEIDWGDLGADTGGGDVIDFGDDEMSVDVTGDIDWGSGGEGAPIELHVTGGDTGETVATGSEALSVLENSRTRATLVDELEELQGFLARRAAELGNSDDDLLATAALQAAPSSAQLDLKQVRELATPVNSLLKHLGSERLQQLLMIRTSPRYVVRVAEDLKQLLRHAEMCEANSRLMVQRREEQGEEEVSIKPKTDLLRTKMKLLKSQMEQEVSKKYKNRPVNIMGEINSV